MKGLIFGLVAAIASVSVGEHLIREQFVAYYAQTLSQSFSAKTHLERIRDDGTWADIDYASKRRGDWPTRVHLDRLKGLAAVYADPASDYHQDEAVKLAVLKGLEHWIEKDYRNPNWYNERIGVPDRLGGVLILMGDAVPEGMLENAKPILMRSRMGLTGQNKVWCAGNNVMIGLLYNEPRRIKKAVEEISSELRVSTEEGIQPDWSFHQHGPQQQFGNYGLSFASDMIMWASILRGTDYELGTELLSILRNYMINGVSWIIWNGRMDFSGCGRHIDEGAQVSKGRGTIRQLALMKTVDPEFSEEYERVADRVGFKPFWRSEMAVQRRPEWYASVKMSSSRVIGAETCNAENMQGLHLGDGVLLVYRDGSEYEDLVPLWNWKRLPGTTCDQGFQSLEPGEADQGLGISNFSGVLGDAETGMAAMIYRRNKLSARKAWFFLKDHIVCMGSGISGETEGAVYTALEQSWMNGAVARGRGWIHHAGIGYQSFMGLPQVGTEMVEGNWNSSFPTRGDRPVNGQVFSLCINHKQSPQDEKYIYRVFPGVSAEQMGAISPSDRSRLLINTTTVQAIECDGTVYAVFYEAGKLKIGRPEPVEVDGPCLLMISDDQIIAADPTHELEKLVVKMGERKQLIRFPQGAEQGKQVEVQ